LTSKWNDAILESPIVVALRIGHLLLAGRRKHCPEAKGQWSCKQFMMPEIAYKAHFRCRKLSYRKSSQAFIVVRPQKSILRAIAIFALGFFGLYASAGAEAVASSRLSSAAPRGAPAPVLHPVEKEAYFQYCTRCHGLGKMNSYPADHAGFAAKSCMGCHKLGAAPEVRGFIAAKATNGKAGRVPHPTDESSYRNCRQCHGLGKSHPFPENHASFAIGDCVACHQNGSATKLAGSGSTDTKAVRKPVLIPHTTEGEIYRDCTQCHGVGKMKPFPANHVSFAKESCTGCHQPASGSQLP